MGDVGVYGLGVIELTYPCVLYGVNYEGVSAAFGGFVHIEIVPQQLVGDLGAVADDGSGVMWDSRVDSRMCGQDKHCVVSRIVCSVRG